MRMTRIQRFKNQKILVIAALFGFTFFLTVGYATFTTKLTLNAKGNIKSLPTYTVSQLKQLVGPSCDGDFIADPNENGRYMYRGANPCNYLTLNDEVWRIISIEPDNTIKIIRQQPIGGIPYDLGYASSVAGITNADSVVGTRCQGLYDSSNYCTFLKFERATGYYGCNIWGGKDTMRDSTGTLLKDTVNGAKIQRDLSEATLYDLPDDNAYLNVYLNGGTYAGVSVVGWYDTWSQGLTIDESSKILSNHSWNVGKTGISEQLITDTINNEKALTWQGRVGLLIQSEYVRASSNPECTSVYSYAYTGTCTPDSFNYLRPSSSFHRLNYPSDMDSVNIGYIVSTTSNINGYRPVNAENVYPALYLSSGTVLQGLGSSGPGAYKIKAQ